MPGPTCAQVDEFRVDNLGNANHTITCTPAAPKVVSWALDANQLLDFKKSLVEDNLPALDSNYGCDAQDKPCNVSTDGQAYSITLSIDAMTKTIDIATSGIPDTLQDAVQRMCSPPGKP